MTERQRSPEQSLEEAVSRSLRDNLVPLQRTADELHQAYADLVAACSSSRPSNALPAMLRAQTAAASLAAGLSVLSNFVAVALKPGEGRQEAVERINAVASSVVVAGGGPEAPPPAPMAQHQVHGEVQAEAPASMAEYHAPAEAQSEPAWVGEQLAEPAAESIEAPIQAAEVEEAVAVEPETPVEAIELDTPVFDVESLPTELRDLHRRANRVAKVAMQDIKLLHPEEVRQGRENKDICHRLRSEIDKARKEYDRRFRAIQDHPVDYFHQWMVEILAGGDTEALGEYPYPSLALRR